MVKDHLGNEFKNKTSLCKQYNLSVSTLYQRLNVEGWDLEKALTTPVQKKTSGTGTKSKTEKKTAKGTSSFVIKSKYPSREYVRYLQYKISELTSALKDLCGINTKSEVCRVVQEKISEYESILRQINKDIFFYDAMDVYAIGGEGAMRMYNRDMVERIKLAYASKDSLIKDIYFTFCDRYQVIRFAVEKQEAPIPPIYKESEYGVYGKTPHCPNCNKEFVRYSAIVKDIVWDTVDFCSSCGTELLWEQRNYHV